MTNTWRPLAVTPAIQALVAMALITVMAPVLAQDLGISSGYVGVYVGVGYAAAMLSSLSAGAAVRRAGAIRASQVALLLCAALPVLLVLVVLALFGASAIGWNGVYLAEVAREAPAGQASIATGGTLAITFLGVVVDHPRSARCPARPALPHRLRPAGLTLVLSLVALLRPLRKGATSSLWST